MAEKDDAHVPSIDKTWLFRGSLSEGGLGALVQLHRGIASEESTSLNIFIWGVAILLHASCKSFAALFFCKTLNHPRMLTNLMNRSPYCSRHVRGFHHSWILDCHEHVLYSQGAKHSSWLLVYVLAPSSRHIRPHQETVLMNGFSQIFTGFVSFGFSHSHSKKLMPWQWLRTSLCLDSASLTKGSG